METYLRVLSNTKGIHACLNIREFTDTTMADGLENVAWKVNLRFLSLYRG